MKKKINKNIPKYKFGAAEVSNAVSVGASGIAGMAGISQDSAVGGALKGLGAGLSSIPTPYTQIAGAALSTVGSFWGEAGSVNQQTGEIDYGSGLSKVFGRSKNSLRRESNRIKNSLVDRELTEKLNYDYYNDPNHSANMNVFAAAEGAVVRKPVLAKVSPGELRIDPNTLKYEEIPGDGGKPNDDDNVTKILGEGEIIASNAEHMKMPNGKTPADNAKIILDSNMSEQQKKKMIKKLTNWQEANKTKPQEYAMYDEGTGKVKARKKEKIEYVVWDGKFGYFDANGGFHDMSGISNQNLPDSAYLGRYEYVDAPIKKGNVGKHTSTELDFNTSRHTRDGVNDKKSESNWRKSPTQEEIDAFYGYDRKKVSETVTKDRSERINNKNRKYSIENESGMVDSIPEVVVTGRKPTKKVNVATNKNTKGVSTTSTPISVTGAIKNPILPEYDRLSFAEPFQFNNQHLRYAPGNYVPIKPLDIEVEDEVVDEIGLPGNRTRSGINWGDLAYKAASIFTPLFDKEKSESVQYQVPIAKYRPTYVDIDPQRRAIDESYAMARYNQSNISPSTGAGMAYGLQAASNRAKQLSDVYSWQTNAQNNLIGRNVDTYNKWSADYAGIMNNVYDKAAANRATARNINRQNVATALKNWGQIRRDDKAYEMDKMKLQMLDPMLQYGYENYDNYLKWKKENGYG